MKQTNKEVEHPYHAHVRNCLDCSGAYGHCSEGLSLLRTGEVKAADSGLPERIFIQKDTSFFQAQGNGTYYRNPDQNSVEYVRADIASKPDSSVNELAATAVEHIQKAWYWKDEDRQIADGLNQAAARLREGLIQPDSEDVEAAEIVHLRECHATKSTHTVECAIDRKRRGEWKEANQTDKDLELK